MYKLYFQVIGTIVLLTTVIYGSYWVAKTVSYSVFYEDMVKQTIQQKVKQNCLVEK
jgi:hypothetical protein